MALCFLVGLHITVQKIIPCGEKMLPSLPPREQLVPIVGFIATNNGRTCQEHCFGCGNMLLLGMPAHCCGVLLRLWKTSPNKLAACFVRHDGSDSCRVGFALPEHAVGARGCSLDGALVRLLEVYTPEHPNSHCHAPHPHKCGYAAKIVANPCN